MTISEYLEREAIGYMDFSFRIHSKTGVQVLPETLRRVARGSGCRAETAHAIVRATDGAVTLDDIVLGQNGGEATAEDEPAEA